MISRKITLLTMSTLLVGSQIVFAQRAVVTTGGDVSGSTGSLSYSVGQTVYAPVEGETGLIYTGVQQPPVTEVVSTNDPSGSFCAQVYPNPFSEMVYFVIGDDSIDLTPDHFTLKLFRADGKLVWQSKVSGQMTCIDPVGIPEGMYILQILHQHHQTISVKLVKTR
jgi:hypothetical protein